VQDLKKRGVEPLVIKQWPDDWLRWLFDFCHKKTGKGNPVHHGKNKIKKVLRK